MTLNTDNNLLPTKLCFSHKFPPLRPIAEKKVAYVIEIFLIDLFVLEAIVLALSNQSVWVDEVYSLAPLRRTWRELIHIQSADVHPPFYFLILKLTACVFGENFFAMKMVSVLPTLFTMICVTIFLNKEFSRKSAVVFLLCSIASEPIIHYSVEIRMYSWALFFITMAAISAWYIIMDSKMRWYAAFLLLAEGAAYTHIYAGLAAGIGYLLLFGYVLKHERKKLIKILALAPLAVLLYLPWFFIITASFTRAANNFWIQPITLKTIAGYVVFVFKASNTLMTLIFFLLFFAVFVFFLKKIKTKKDWFAFALLSNIIILAGLGIAVSLAVRPLLVDRYLFPACGLVWLFFAVVCGSIQNKRAIVFVCGVLLVCGITTFSISFYQERKENNDFARFYNYLKDEIRPRDIFIFPPEASHLAEISAYLFPGHDQVYEIKSPGLGDAFWEMFDRNLIDYTQLADSDRFQGQGAWIFVSETDNQGRPATFVIPPESGAEFRGDFGWGFYQFKFYYTESPAVLEAIFGRLFE